MWNCLTKGYIDMATDHNLYHIIPGTVQPRISEAISLAIEMAKEHYPHLVDGLEFTQKAYRDSLESFRGSHNKPRTTKAF